MYFRLMDKGYWNIVYVYKRGYFIVKDVFYKLIKNLKCKEIFYYYNNKKMIWIIDIIWLEYVCFNFLFENDLNYDRFFVIWVL